MPAPYSGSTTSQSQEPRIAAQPSSAPQLNASPSTACGCTEQGLSVQEQPFTEESRTSTLRYMLKTCAGLVHKATKSTCQTGRAAWWVMPV